MIISKKAFEDYGFGDIRWVVNWSAVFVEMGLRVVVEAVVALYHVNDVFRV